MFRAASAICVRLKPESGAGAARLMEELQEMGYVGGDKGKPTKGREIKVIGETPEDEL